MESIPFITKSPIGNLRVYLQNNKLSKIEFLANNLPTNKSSPQSALAKKILRQLHSYFTNPKYKFTIPLNLHGTPFQQRVWQALQKIPCGKRVTYAQLAQQLHTSPRAIGGACGRNPIPLIIPCHRVVAKNSLGGFCQQRGGKKLQIKKWLLEKEKQW